MWKVYKSKVMKTLNPEYEEDAAEEVRDLQGFAVSKCWEKSMVVVGIESQKVSRSFFIHRGVGRARYAVLFAVQREL